MKIGIGSDHGGFDLKEVVRQHLENEGFEVVDFGTYNKDSVDYPDFGKAVAEAVVNNQVEKGIVICGTGIGISIAANKVLDDEYKDYIDSKFTDSGGMLLNIQRTVRNLSTTTVTPGTPSNGAAEPIYIELPPEMGRAILRLLRDADDDRLETIEWKRWYCKHNPEHHKCGEWFP